MWAQGHVTRVPGAKSVAWRTDALWPQIMEALGTACDMEHVRRLSSRLVGRSTHRDGPRACAQAPSRFRVSKVYGLHSVPDCGHLRYTQSQAGVLLPVVI